MADDILLGLKLSIKEFLDSFKQAGEAAKEEVKKVNQELDNITGDEFGKNLGENFDGINVTVNDLLERLDDLKEKLKSAPIGGEAYTRWAGEIHVVEGELKKANATLKGTENQTRLTTLQTGSYRTAIVQGLDAIRQINPALGDFVSGLNPMLTGLSSGITKGQGFKAMLASLTTQIAGPLGIAIGIGLLSTLISQLIGNMKKASDETLDLSLKSILGTSSVDQLREAVKKLKDELKDLTNEQLVGRLGELQTKLSEISQDIITTDFRSTSGPFGLGYLANRLMGKNPEEMIAQLEKVKLIIDEINKKLEIKPAGTERGIVQRLKDQITINEELREMAQSTAEVEKYNQRLVLLKEKLKGLTETEKKETKDLLEQYIESDKELIKQMKEIDNLLSRSNLSVRERTLLVNVRLKVLGSLVDDQNLINKIIDDNIKGKVTGSNRLWDTNIYKDDDVLLDNFKSKGTASNILGEGGASGTKEELKQLAEKNKLLKEQKTTWQEIKSEVGEVSRAFVSALVSSFNLIKRNQTALDQFINAISRAVLEMLALKAATAILNIITGGLSGGAGAASSVPIGPAMPGGGGVFKKSVTGGGYNYGSAVATRNAGGNYSGSQITLQPVVMDVEMSGRSLYLVQRKINNLKSKF